MAAEVEVQTGQVGSTVVGGRPHLSPLTDSSNSLIDIPPINQSHIMAPEPNKLVPNPKPRLTPKPFAVERNTTIKPIVAPKPQTKTRPVSTHLAGYKLEVPCSTKPQQPSATGKPRPVSANLSRPASTSFKTSSMLATGQTTKLVVQPFKPAPSLDLGDPSRPTPTFPAERQKPSHLGYSKSLKNPPAAEWSGTTNKEEKDRSTSSNGRASMTRAKSLGFLVEVGKEDGEKQKPEAAVPLQLQPGASRPRPVSAIFLDSPTKMETPVPAPRWAARRPLSTDLTSRFESIGLSLHRRTPKINTKENTQQGKALSEKTPKGTDGKANPAASAQSNQNTEEVPVAETYQSKNADLIKSRMNLLLDSSSSPGVTQDLLSPVQPVPETEPPVGVKQLIKQLTVDPTQSPAVRPTLKPRPLPLDLTKMFSSERLPDLGSVSLSDDRHDIISKDPQRGIDESALCDQRTFVDSQELPKKASTPERPEAGQMLATASKEGGPSSDLQTVRASLFENVVERHNVLMVDQGKPVKKAKDSPSSPSFKSGNGEDEGTLVTAIYKDPVSPSSPLRVVHAFDTVLAVEESRAVSENVPSAQREDKAMTLRTRRSEGSRPAADRTGPAVVPQQQPRYLRVGALQKWTNTGPEQEKGMLTQWEEPEVLMKDQDRHREAEQEEVAAAPKRLKMLHAEEQAKPRATYFALTGQLQEPFSPVDTGASLADFDDVSVKSALAGSQGNILPVRRNPSFRETFGKTSQDLVEGMRSHKSHGEISSALDGRTTEEAMEVEKKRELKKEMGRHKATIKELEKEKQRQLELEREALLEFERMKDMEMQREFERQRQKAFEKEKRELEEKQRKLERQKQMELEKQKAQELERLERERQRQQRELERQRKAERERQERERQREQERQRQREEERQRELDKERQQLEIQKEKQKMEELQRIKELETQQLLEFQKQKELREKKERDEAEKIKQMALEQEMLRLREIEKERERQREIERERQKDIEREKQKELERRRQRDLERERQRQLDIERQELENQRLRQEVERERQRKEEMERFKEMERRQLLEMAKQKQAEKERILEYEKQQLREKIEREEAERMRQIAKQQEAERQRLKERQKEEEERSRLEASPLRPLVVDIDSVFRNTTSPKSSSQRSDPATRWKEPSVRPEESYKPAILDIDSFTSQAQHPISKDLSPVSCIQGLDPGLGVRLQPEREISWKVPHQTLLGISSPVWTTSPQDPWELFPVADQPVAQSRKQTNKISTEQLLLQQEEQLPAPQRHWSALLDDPIHLAPFPGTEAQSSPAGVSGGAAVEPMWFSREPPDSSRDVVSRRSQGSQGSQVLNRMRSRSVSRRSAPSGGAVEAGLSRLRSRSAHREQDCHSSLQQKQSNSGEEERRGSAETPPHETDSQYGTWETGLHTDGSLTPATPSSESPSPRKPTSPHTPGEPSSLLDTDTMDSVPPPPSSEDPMLPFPEAPAALLDTSALRSRAQLAKKRAPRTRPTRANRQNAAASEGGTAADWLHRDSTEPKAESKDDDCEEQSRGGDSSSAITSQPQRIALFPGMDPSALKAQLKKRSDSDNPTDGPAPSPSQISRSPRSPFLPRAARVLPPPGGKETSEEDSPQWLKELKSKKRLSQFEMES